MAGGTGEGDGVPAAQPCGTHPLSLVRDVKPHAGHRARARRILGEDVESEKALCAGPESVSPTASRCQSLKANALPAPRPPRVLFCETLSKAQGAELWAGAGGAPFPGPAVAALSAHSSP